MTHTHDGSNRQRAELLLSTLSTRQGRAHAQTIASMMNTTAMIATTHDDDHDRVLTKLLLSTPSTDADGDDNDDQEGHNYDDRGDHHYDYDSHGVDDLGPLEPSLSEEDHSGSHLGGRFGTCWHHLGAKLEPQRDSI